MGWSEADLLAWLSRRPRPAALRGSQGHDAAVLRGLRTAPVLCVDQVVEGVHADPGTAPRRLGRKAAGRALSDLAATAARPVGLLLALAAPPSESTRRLRAAIEGVAEKAREHGADLVGGDLSTTRAGGLTLAVSALGEAPAGRPPGRDRARPGDVVLLTGAVGGSRLGRHLDPAPRLAEGAFLHACGARALMDVSDGLALDLARLARASGVRIDLTSVPLHPDARRAARRDGRDALAHALGDGEDHELIACLPAAAWARARARALRRFPALVEIGRVRAGAGVVLLAGGAARRLDRDPGGWVHGG